MAEGDWAGVARAVAGLAEEGRFSGSVLVTRGDETLLEHTAGLADRANGRAIHPGTRFALASLSKPFTAAAVLSCVRDGLLGTGDRVAELLPAARRPRTMSGQVTVHHLLTHSSGIGDYAEEDEDLPGYVDDYGSLWRDLPTYRMERPDDFLPLYADATPVTEPGAEFHYNNAGYVLLGAVLEQVTGRDYVDAAPVAEPGTEFHYSNAGYVLLGAVLEEVTGGSFVDAVTERVLRPAGMADSGYFRLDDAVPDLALGYLPSGRSNLYSTPVIGGGDGGAFATARDLDRFFRSIAAGTLLGVELTGLMRTRHVPIDDQVAMGYGLFLSETAFSHGGGDPGVETGARHYPGPDLSMVVLCNEEGTLDAVWDLVEAALPG